MAETDTRKQRQRKGQRGNGHGFCSFLAFGQGVVPCIRENLKEAKPQTETDTDRDRGKDKEKDREI